jgi:hypothetical protein
MSVAEARFVLEPNGCALARIWIYQCQSCGCDIRESLPHALHRGNRYCRDCAFRSGLITEREYLEWCGISPGAGYRAGIQPATGEIVVIHCDQLPWLLHRRDRERDCAGYRFWRQEVFVRDNYTCQDCGQRGGVLNAHHIQPWAKNHALRFAVSNGVTLCRACHKARHHKKAGV